MASTEKPGDEVPQKKSKMPLIIGVVLMLLLGGGGFYAVHSGLILAASDQVQQSAQTKPDALPDIAFIALEPMVISLRGGTSRHLRFTGQLEVAAPYAKDVELLKPRVVDVLNSYLRAVDVRDLEDQTTLVRLRAQMLRRVQLVTGEGRVRDLLVMEFVLN